MNQIFKDNDIILLKETLSNNLFNYNVENCDYYVLHRKMKSKYAKRDSGGLIVYVHQKLKPYVELLKFSGDCMIWLKCSKTLFNFENDLFLCLVYNIPKGSSREML